MSAAGSADTPTRLREFGPSLYVADGPEVSFFGFPYPTRMAIARLRDGSVWVWSPIALDESLAREVESIGPVRHIVSPNKLHHLFSSAWVERWPEATVYAPPGLAKRRPQLRFDVELGDQAAPAWVDDIDQTIFRGSFAMDEVVFFHRASRTAIVGDLVQRHERRNMKGLKGAMMRIDGLVGPAGSTPREWRMSFLRRAPARAARAKVLGWEPERLLIAHGECAQEGATEILRRAFAWI